MSKVAVVYWSATGNTEAMAKAVAAGAEEKGAEVVLLQPKGFESAVVAELDAIAFGCPAMGDEVLEEEEFDPMWSACSTKLGGKKVALFGSYGWGDGDWMKSWEKDCSDKGINLVCDSVICCETPGDADIAACKALGAALV